MTRRGRALTLSTSSSSDCLYCLGENPADGRPLLEGFLSDFFVNSRGNSHVNLAVECSGHRNPLSLIPLYHGIFAGGEALCCAGALARAANAAIQASPEAR